MKYIDREREKVVEIRDKFFRDPGKGIYRGKEREFVLSEPKLNLWEGVREDAIKYFSENKISWWVGNNEPSGHLLSSQIACINHLYPLRQRKELCSYILNNIDEKIISALLVDNGFIEFEKTGIKPVGSEKSIQRGANSTSIDALMVGEKENSQRVLVLIEWKYTESYTNNSLLISESGKNRLQVYEDLLEDGNSPISCKNFEYLFYEPYYQLTRQTLLAWQMSKRKEYDVDDWLHIHVIPKENVELRKRITSKNLIGNTLEESWKKLLKFPEKYIVVSPEDFIKPICNCADTKSVLNYLGKRYWK